MNDLFWNLTFILCLSLSSLYSVCLCVLQQQQQSLFLYALHSLEYAIDSA